MGIFRQFPYSNFHDMNMDEIIKICRELQDAWTATSAEWANYKDFIDNYFATLDVSEEVLQALRAMAADGTLNQIIDPVIATATAAWLNEHVTPTTPIIDSSLTIAGAGADAKAVGDIFKNVLYRKTIPNDILSGHLLSHLIESGCYPADITFGGWTDSPNGVDGVIWVMQYTNNYMIQVYWEYGGATNNMYYRIVNRTTYAIYKDWTMGDDIENTINTAIGFKRVPAALIATHLISNIVDAGVYDIDVSLGWTDAPGTYNGVLLNSRYGTNYNIQIYFEFTAPVGMNNVYFRIVNKNTFAVYHDWAPFNTDLHIRFDSINDTYLTDNNITDFTQLPVNTVCSVEISNANYSAINLPYARPGSLISIKPYPVNSGNFNFTIWLYITNTPASDQNQMYISFGHGQAHTAWSPINTFNGIGNINPFASAVINKDPIVFIGDSIIAGLGGTGYDISQAGGGEFLMQYNGVDRYENIQGHCWVNSMISYLSSIYNHTNVKNHGIGGITTAALDANFDTLVPATTKMVVIMVGTNDYTKPENITANLPLIIRKCNDKKMKVIVMTTIPTNKADADLYTRIKGYIVSACNLYGAIMVDMCSEFIDYLTFKNLSLASVLNADGIHPDDTGYDIMFHIAKKLLHI